MSPQQLDLALAIANGLITLVLSIIKLAGRARLPAADAASRTTGVQHIVAGVPKPIAAADSKAAHKRACVDGR